MENNNELININYNGDNQTVFARELYEFLEVNTPFRLWFPRMCEYGFEEDRDFTPYIFVHPQNKQETTDYQLTTEMAKEISMLQRTDKGKLARQYFIELEKKWNSPEAVMARALSMANKTIENLKLHTSLLENKIEEQAPKVAMAERFATTDSLMGIRKVAKIINQRIKSNKAIGEKKLFEILRNEEILQSSKGEWNIPYQRYIDAGYFELKPSTHSNGFGGVITEFTSKVTGKGLEWLWKYLLRKEYVISEDVKLLN